MNCTKEEDKQSQAISQSEAETILDSTSTLQVDHGLEPWSKFSKIVLVSQRFPKLNISRQRAAADLVVEVEDFVRDWKYQHKPSEHLNNIVHLWFGDITRIAVDAIVNAAHPSLLGGGGVDGAIHRAAGPELKDACAELKGCEIGEAKLTAGFNLPAKSVIHTVGPGRSSETAKLNDCYRACCRIASENRIRSIAFPCISTGAYLFPKVQAASIALSAVREWLRSEDAEGVTKVVFCVLDSDNDYIYQTLMPLYFPL